MLIGASGDGPQAGSAEGGEERGAGPGDGSAALRLGDLCCRWPARAVGISAALPEPVDGYDLSTSVNNLNTLWSTIRNDRRQTLLMMRTRSKCSIT